MVLAGLCSRNISCVFYLTRIDKVRCGRSSAIEQATYGREQRAGFASTHNVGQLLDNCRTGAIW